MTGNVKPGDIVRYCFKLKGELVERPAIVVTVNPAQQNVDLTVFFVHGDQQPGQMLGHPTAVGQSITPIEGCWRFGTGETSTVESQAHIPLVNVTKSKHITKRAKIAHKKKGHQ